MAKPPPSAGATAALEIRIKRGKDGPDSFVITRPDGSFTHQQDRTGGFFPPHDLTHFVVETELGFRHGFYGVVADGWDFADFGHPWPRGPMPDETVVPEAIVGLLDQERAAGLHWTAEEFSRSLADFLGPRGRHAPPFTEPLLATIRGRRDELIDRWRALRPGETMRLFFPIG